MPFKSDLQKLLFHPLEGEDTWTNKQAIVYYSKQFDVTITVPPRFETDFASIPRIARFYLSPTSKHIRLPAVIHDYIYVHLCHLYTKEMADCILVEAMSEVKSPCRPSKRRMVYYAVKFGGKGNW